LCYAVLHRWWLSSFILVKYGAIIVSRLREFRGLKGAGSPKSPDHGDIPPHPLPSSSSLLPLLINIKKKN
jgi:hypothetical protein